MAHASWTCSAIGVACQHSSTAGEDTRCAPGLGCHVMRPLSLGPGCGVPAHPRSGGRRAGSHEAGSQQRGRSLLRPPRRRSLPGQNDGRGHLGAPVDVAECARPVAPRWRGRVAVLNPGAAVVPLWEGIMDDLRYRHPALGEERLLAAGGRQHSGQRLLADQDGHPHQVLEVRVDQGPVDVVRARLAEQRVDLLVLRGPAGAVSSGPGCEGGSWSASARRRSSAGPR